MYDYENKQIGEFSIIQYIIFWIYILKLILKLNSMSIKEKKHECSFLLDKTLYVV